MKQTLLYSKCPPRTWSAPMWDLFYTLHGPRETILASAVLAFHPSAAEGVLKSNLCLSAEVLPGIAGLTELSPSLVSECIKLDQYLVSGQT